jgi:hypothetical protein
MGIITNVNKERAANLLEYQICQGVCDNNTHAINWLLIHVKPSINEIVQPEIGSFIYCCRMLGINWRLLRKTLKGAFEVVPSNEHKYDEDYEICHSKTGRQDIEMQRGIRSTVVPFARKRPSAY